MQSKPITNIQFIIVNILGMKLIILTLIIFTVIIPIVAPDSCDVANIIQCVEPPTSIDIQCFILSQNDTAIQAAIRDCTAGNFVSLYVITRYTNVDYMLNLTMLPDNIQRLSIQGYYGVPKSNDHHLRLVTNTVHPNILNIEVFRMNVDNTFEERDFFQNFPNAIVMRFLYIKFLYHPILQGLSSMERLQFHGYSTLCYGVNPKRIDQSLAGGLTSLESFIWDYGCVESVVPGAFQDLGQVTFLSLEYNQLDVNISQLLGRNSFTGLTKLQMLDLNYNSIVNLNSEVLNGLINLEEVELNNNPLVCSCELQWISTVKSFGIDVIATCSSNGSLKAVDSESIYTGCNQLLSYQCFNRDNNCTHECIDTPSSYVCGCGEGYGLVLGWDSQNCEDIDECLYSRDNCEQECINILGSYSCSCYEGYQLVSDGNSCVDIDECNTTQQCHHICSNRIGSYACSCYAGYTLSTDGSACLDVNECMGENTCTSLCVNTKGSYTCQCEDGFSANSTNCTDINECDFDNAGCQHTCINIIGGYVCQCRPGYVLDDNNVSHCVTTSDISLFGLSTSSEAVLTIIILAFIAMLFGVIIIIILCIVIVGRNRRISEVKREKETLMIHQFSRTADRSVYPEREPDPYTYIDDSYVQINEDNPNSLPNFVSLQRNRTQESKIDVSVSVNSNYVNPLFSSPKYQANTELELDIREMTL